MNVRFGVSVLIAGAIGSVAAAQDQKAAEQPASWTEGWTGSVELGLNGSDGNTETFNFRGGITGERITLDYETRAGFVYSYTRNDGTDTENRANAFIRNDWLLAEDSKWRIFALGDATFDDFQDWDYRVSAFGGVGYEFIDTDKTFLLGRVGLGVTREIGGSENAFIPEGVLGADFTHKLTERQKVYANVDFYPALDDFGPYRLVSRAGWEILVDPETSMSLKLGVEDRYDSDPGDGFKRNDLDYFALLVWSF